MLILAYLALFYKASIVQHKAYTLSSQLHHFDVLLHFVQQPRLVQAQLIRLSMIHLMDMMLGGCRELERAARASRLKTIGRDPARLQQLGSAQSDAQVVDVCQPQYICQT